MAKLNLWNEALAMKAPSASEQKKFWDVWHVDLLHGRKIKTITDEVLKKFRKLLSITKKSEL